MSAIALVCCQEQAISLQAPLQAIRIKMVWAQDEAAADLARASGRLVVHALHPSRPKVAIVRGDRTCDGMRDLDLIVEAIARIVSEPRIPPLGAPS